MAESAKIRLSMSSKDTFPRGRSEDDPAEEDETLPCQSVKQPYIQYHVTSDYIDAHFSNHRSTLLPEPDLRSRKTPVRLQAERVPGTYDFSEIPTLVKTPWEHRRAKRQPLHWSCKPEEHILSAHLFEKLPREVLHCILDKLKEVHTIHETVMVADWQDDLRALCKANRRWYRVAQEHLYCEIWLPSNEGPARRRFSFVLTKQLTRLQLLLRTLKESLGLARTVRHLRVTSKLNNEIRQQMTRDPSECKGVEFQILADIVACCPNLEYLTGYMPSEIGPFFNILAAMCSLSNLKAHCWYVPPGSSGIWRNTRNFIASHSKWQQLDTFVFWQSKERSALIPGTLFSTLQRLPALKHLMLRGLPRANFHNGTLLMLPHLKCLRLEDLEGVNDEGLEQLAYSRLAMSLEKLTLVDQQVTTLRAVQGIFANFARLRHFNLVQETSPELQEEFTITSVDFALESTTLQQLRWDTVTPSGTTAIIANSIAAGKFPRLTKVAVPCDYDGAIQRFCRPMAVEHLTAADFVAAGRYSSSGSHRRPLRISQIQAQLRIRASRQLPLFNVVVQDEHNRVNQVHVIGSFVGNLGSKVEYSLEPGIPGTEHIVPTFDDVTRPAMMNGRERVLDLQMLF